MKQKILITLYVYISSLVFISCCNNSTPSKLTDQEAMVRAMEWQEQHPIFSLAPTDWTNGAYYIGVTKAYQSTQNESFLSALKNMGYKNEWKPLYRTYHADDIAIAYSYLFIHTTRINLVDLKPTTNWINEHLYGSNKWIDESEPSGFKKTLWWWCDALFMAPPVITYYATPTGDLQYLNEMHKHYKETYDLLFDKEESLFARDVRFKITGNENDRKEANGEKIFWSRGNGWVLGGLALILNDMPSDYEHRKFYEDLFKTMAEKIKDIQPADGLWRVSLLDPDAYNHGEVSGSGFFTFAMAWGINNDLLNKDEYKPVVEKAWKALRQCQHNNGQIGWVQNIGDSPKPANEESWQNYGTGAFLLAGSEIIKMSN